MNSTGNKVILRYKQSDLEATQRSIGGLYMDTSFNPNEHVCQVAYIEADSKKLNEEHLLFRGDFVLVQYLVGLDTLNNNKEIARNQFFVDKDGKDEIRWCDASQIFGKKTDEGFQPQKGFVFCELLKDTTEHLKNGIWVLDKKQDSDTKGFQTTIRYIHPHDAEELGLGTGETIMCKNNSDAIKKAFGEELLRIPADCILGTVCVE